MVHAVMHQQRDRRATTQPASRSAEGVPRGIAGSALSSAPGLTLVAGMDQAGNDLDPRR